ncbi:MAG: SAM-dependent methyltransferase [Bacteroidota bacterium]
MLISKKGKATLRQQTIQQKRSSGAVQHDHAKARSIATDSPYLHALGITNKQGKVLQQGQRKFRQINKYLELIGHLLEQQPLRDQAHIVDMGSGKGYLTFALYDYLQRQQNVQLTGIELRPKLVKQCNEVAQECNFEHLRFLAQDIHDFQPDGGIDMLIALHACDTATDEAIAKGIRAEAQLIVVAPCCHKQVRKAMQPPNKLQPMLQHGILLERQAEMLTDAIRSLLLEAHGYETKVFEFINTAHTPKNVMITAVKGRPNQAALGQIAALKRQFGINFHHLERLLAN